ncbi:MAG: hypothetical protein MZU91_14350 [Desulfosudis oleivorans]|nr:hypothetical protein [Desulfosudis oleivorans]
MRGATASSSREPQRPSYSQPIFLAMSCFTCTPNSLISWSLLNSSCPWTVRGKDPGRARQRCLAGPCGRARRIALVHDSLLEGSHVKPAFPAVPRKLRKARAGRSAGQGCGRGPAARDTWRSALPAPEDVPDAHRFL